MKNIEWPYKPESLSGILPNELPYFIQAGVNHILKRAVSVINPKSHERFDSFDSYDNYASFCRCLRGQCKENEIKENLDETCKEFDQIAAKKFIQQFDNGEIKELTIIKYLCYLGLEEMATIIKIGELPLMVVSGQFLSKDGVEDIRASLDNIGIRCPINTEISKKMRETITRFELPEILWTKCKLIDNEKKLLMDKLNELKHSQIEFENDLLREAKRIKEIGENYLEINQKRLENQIKEKIMLSLLNAMKQENFLWEKVENCLEIMKDALNLEYIAFFSSELEETILYQKILIGNIDDNYSLRSHFNWKKSKLDQKKNIDSSNNNFLIFPPYSDEIKIKAYKGSQEILSKSSLIYSTTVQGLYGLLILGQHKDKINLKEHSNFIQEICRDISTLILFLQLSNIYKIEKSDWEKTARLTGHRIRSSCQYINSLLNIIKEFSLTNEIGYTENDANKANTNLQKAFKELLEISYSAESDIKGASDVKSVHREWLNIKEVIDLAIEAQRELAEENDIIIESNDIYDSPLIFVNKFLMKSAFINLINNGLKYSYPKFQEKNRVFKIQKSNEYDNNKFVAIEFVNFGLGIKKEDYERIFFWGERLTTTIKSNFKEVYGKGYGLWEVKHIIEGHGGKIFVKSIHYTKAEVTDSNINQCITIFTVLLPIN